MTVKRPRHDRVVLLAPQGQRRLEDVYEKRSRRRASWTDHAESYLRCLEDEDRLKQYLLEDLDPFEALASANGDGKDGLASRRGRPAP